MHWYGKFKSREFGEGELEKYGLEVTDGVRVHSQFISKKYPATKRGPHRGKPLPCALLLSDGDLYLINDGNSIIAKHQNAFKRKVQLEKRLSQLEPTTL